jgi:hypothetical protein
MSVESVTEQAMQFVEKYQYYYDIDWGRTRCHFCGHSDVGGKGGSEITHAKDCQGEALKTEYARIKDEIQKKQIADDEEVDKLMEER